MSEGGGLKDKLSLKFKKVFTLGFFVLAFFIFGLGFGRDANAENYYLDNSVTDCADYDPVSRACGSGTETARDTLSKVVGLCDGNDNIYVMPGTYTPTTYVLWPGVNIQLLGYTQNPDDVVFELSNMSSSLFLTSGSSDDGGVVKYITFKNFTTAVADRVISISDSDNWEIYHNKFIDVAFSIRISSMCHNVKIKYNLFKGIFGGSSGDGFSFNDFFNLDFSNNIINASETNLNQKFSLFASSGSASGNFSNNIFSGFYNTLIYLKAENIELNFSNNIVMGHGIVDDGYILYGTEAQFASTTISNNILLHDFTSYHLLSHTGDINSIYGSPELVDYPRFGIMTLGIDDTGEWDSAKALAAAGNPLGYHATHFVTSAYLTASEIPPSELQAYLDNGNTVGTHAFSHPAEFETTTNRPAFTWAYSGAGTPSIVINAIDDTTTDPRTNPSSEWTMTLDLKVDGSSIGGDFPINLQSPSYDKIGEAVAKINNEVNWSATLDPTYVKSSYSLSRVLADGILTTSPVFHDPDRYKFIEIWEPKITLEDYVRNNTTHNSYEVVEWASPGNGSSEEVVNYIKSCGYKISRTGYEAVAPQESLLTSVNPSAIDTVGPDYFKNDEGVLSEEHVKALGANAATAGALMGTYFHGDFNQSEFEQIFDWLQPLVDRGDLLIMNFKDTLNWLEDNAEFSCVDGGDYSSCIGSKVRYDVAFTDTFNGNLIYSSPAIDAGTNVGLTTDYAGNPIYGTPDIGAYEYQPPHTMGSDKIDIEAGARIYGDGKFRDKEIISANLADLTITPESGSFETYESDEIRPEWMDIKNISWGDTKQWTESSPISSLTNTLHTVGDLEANKYYNVSVDNILGENIEGENCISGICKSNSEGKIAFTYTGTYSEHTFKIEIGDNTSPAVTSGTTLKFPTDTKEVTLSITTNENSTCKYSANESDGYDAMTAFETTGEKTHSTMYQTIHGAAIYNVYAICRDVMGNDTSHTLTFEIAKAKEDSKISGIKSDNLTLDENKKIYLEEDRTKLKGEDQLIANGKVKIYKNKKLYKEITVDENGKWSKKISFDHDRNYTIGLEFFDEFGTLRDEKEYEIKVDTEKPVFQNEEESSSITKDERISFPAEDEETKIDHYKIKVLDKNGQIIRKWKKQSESFYLIPNKIKDEAKTIIVRAYDRAGNKSELRFNIDPRKALPRGEGPAQSSVAEEVQEVTGIKADTEASQQEELQESLPEPTTENNPPEAKTEIQPTASEVPANNPPASESKWWNPFSWF